VGGPDGNGGGPLGPPAGTYGELRAASGTTSVTLPVGSGITAKPDLPRSPPLDRLFTVSGDGGRYRVLAQRDPRNGGILIAAVPLREADQQLERLLVVEAFVIAAVLLVLGIAGWAVVRVGLLPLDRMGHTAGRIAGGDLSHRVEAVDPRTEVGRLGIALNRMLDRLEEAFTRRRQSEDRLRTFIADASHELRTPLASIRGYAELFRMGAVPEDERERAMRRIEDEAARMGVLVEDLLTLARLDQIADAPHAELDLAALAGDAVDDARATAPDREITLQARRAPVNGDAHQLRQVLGNLLRNALMHTPAGSPIEVIVEPAPDRVRLTVRDHGPGLPTDEVGAIFERFWRAEGGRKQGKGGAGLGLAIVAGIVDAHGGRVDARNADGDGAAFVVELPALSNF
jgi:two-component system OmpR family sensor kinase